MNTIFDSTSNAVRLIFYAAILGRILQFHCGQWYFQDRGAIQKWCYAPREVHSVWKFVSPFKRGGRVKRMWYHTFLNIVLFILLSLHSLYKLFSVANNSLYLHLFSLNVSQCCRFLLLTAFCLLFSLYETYGTTILGLVGFVYGAWQRGIGSAYINQWVWTILDCP